MVVYAGVEGGGTTWRVALAEGHPSNIVESQSFVTLDDAQEQLKEIKDWLSTRKYDCLGIGTFGPIDPREGGDLIKEAARDATRVGLKIRDLAEMTCEDRTTVSKVAMDTVMQEAARSQKNYESQETLDREARSV